MAEFKILAKYGEIALKGDNKRFFERILIANVKEALSLFGRFKIVSSQSTLEITPIEKGDYSLNDAVKAVSRVFGLSAVSPCIATAKDFNKLVEMGVPYIQNIVKAPITFKVIAKRSDKKFPMTSPEICEKFGEVLLNQIPFLKVDVKNPQIEVRIEVRDNEIFLNTEKIKAAGGVPVGSSGKGLLLLSGGIDSPVAGYLAAKRGLSLTALHFQSPPFTSERAFLKVKKLAEIVGVYTGKIPIEVSNITDFGEELREKFKEKPAVKSYFTILLRREMMRRATKFCIENKINCIITGDSLGQVASQTLSALECTENAAGVQVIRPLICMDKTEITKISQSIDAFETSILPYHDCCSIYTPRHPILKPKLKDVLKIEEEFGIGE